MYNRQNIQSNALKKCVLLFKVLQIVIVYLLRERKKMKDSNNSKRNKALTIAGIVLCVILIPILIVNCTLIVKSIVNKDEVPDFGGLMPLIVLSDSMYPDIKSGDLIFCTTVEAEEIQVDDVISFFDPAGNGSAVVTHKVIEVIEDGDERSFRTKGINNNTEDRLPVQASKLVGRYTGVRLPAIGNVALFMQTTPGLIVCVILPIVLMMGYDIIRRKLYDKNKDEDIEALRAELAALKAMKTAEAEKTEALTAEAAEPAADASKPGDEALQPAEEPPHVPAETAEQDSECLNETNETTDQEACENKPE